MFTTLISVTELQQLQSSRAPLMVFDCSFDLMQPAIGRQQFEQEHIAGALHADLDHNLSAPKGAANAASGGRHPLPAREHFAAWLRSIGFDSAMQAVVYDRQGTVYCGRLWWMLKWLGHAQVAVLNGGWQAWQAAGGATESGAAAPAPAPSTFAPGEPLVRLVNVRDVEQSIGKNSQVVIDARAPARYRGEMEPIDPVAGHIPGALNRPFGSNLDERGQFKPAAVLKQEFESLLGQRTSKSVVHQCGSGVSAVPNLLAMEIAGLHGSALFAGSWSEWCSDPQRPVARG